MPRIRIKNGPNKGLVFPVMNEVVSLGRDAASTIQVLDKGASRHHSEIYRVGAMCFIRDLDSRNSTYLNGEPIDEELLRPDDRVQIGSTILVYEEDGAPPRDTAEIDLSPAAAVGEEELFHHTLEIRLDDLHWVDQAETARTPPSARQFEALFLAGRAVAEERDQKALIVRVLELISELVPADGIYLYLREENSGKLVPHGRLERNPTRGEVRISRTIIQRALRERRAILTSNAMADARFKANQSIIVNRIRSVICVPMEARERTVGVLYLQSDSAQSSFRQDDLEVLTAVGLQIAIGLAALHAETRSTETLIGVVRTLVAVMESRAPARRGRAERVRSYAAAIADEMALNPEERLAVDMTALLADVARMEDPGIADYPAGRDPAVERAIAGARIVAAMPDGEPMAAAIRALAERVDGRGGPDGLSAEQIPIAARVVAAAVAFHDHAARSGDADEAIRRLSSGDMAGALDPDMVAALVRAHRAGALMAPVP